MAIYLDNAATSFPKPDCVYEAVDDFMRNNGSAFGRGSHGAANNATNLVAQCRHRLAQILDAEADNRIAFTFNCTDGLNLLLRGILKRGDRVVTTTLEHNSVLRPLEQLKKEIELDVVHVNFDPVTGVVNAEQFIAELEKHPTRLAVLNHASNVTGVIQPVQELARAARRANVLFMLDAAQTVGHFPFSVRDLGVDVLAAAGHKGLLGPLGTGLIYIKSGLESIVSPMRTGGTGTASESLKQPGDMPHRFESGNLNLPGIVGLNASTDWLLKRGLANIYEHTNQLTCALQEGLSEIEGVTLIANMQTQNTGVVSFCVNSLDPQDVAAILDQSFQIQCRAGLHCAPLVHQRLGTSKVGGTIRLSPGIFSKAGDVETALAAVAAIATS